jgi:alkylated DNA nucleotide flippase Atl1
VPCHRVVPSGGGVGKYGGQEWRKEYLLGLEGALHGHRVSDRIGPPGDTRHGRSR